MYLVQVEIVIIAGAASILAQETCLVRLVDSLLEHNRLVEILYGGQGDLKGKVERVSMGEGKGEEGKYGRGKG